MGIPFRPVGVGQVAAKNVFRINFSTALSAIPSLHAWDDFNLAAVAKKIFTGTTVNGNKPIIGAIGLDAAPGASWWPATSVAGAAVNNASRLKGNDGFCKLAASAPGAGGDVFFNFDFSFPDDVFQTDDVSFALSVAYRFTGATPSVTWYGNDGGTEGAPVWTALTTQPKGTQAAATRVWATDAGATGLATDSITIPTSGEAFPAEIWAIAAA